MAAIALAKHGATFAPADAQSAARASRLGDGEVIQADVRFRRNGKFHRKFFALLNYAYEVWEPDMPTYKGQVCAKNFDRFREDITILAGYGEPVVNVRGEVRMQAKSIAFRSMEDDEFAELYSAVLDVLLKKVLTNHTAEDVERVVENLMGFA